MTLAEEPALLRVVFGDALVGEVAGEFLLLWAAILSLTVVVARFCRLRVGAEYVGRDEVREIEED